MGKPCDLLKPAQHSVEFRKAVLEQAERDNAWNDNAGKDKQLIILEPIGVDVILVELKNGAHRSEFLRSHYALIESATRVNTLLAQGGTIMTADGTALHALASQATKVPMLWTHRFDHQTGYWIGNVEGGGKKKAAQGNGKITTVFVATPLWYLPFPAITLKINGESVKQTRAIRAYSYEDRHQRCVLCHDS